MFSISIVRWSDLHNIGGDEVDPLQTAKDCSEFASGPSSSLWGTGRRCDCFVLANLMKGNGGLTSWVERVDVDGEVDWFGSTNTVDDLFDDPIHSDRVNFSRLNNFKATISVVVIIAGTTQSCPDTSMDVGVIRK